MGDTLTWNIKITRSTIPFQWALSASGLGLRETISGTRTEVRRLSTAAICHVRVKTKIIKLNSFVQLGNQLNPYTACEEISRKEK